MILYDLLRTQLCEETLETLYRLYPDQVINDAGYRSMWDELLTYKPAFAPDGDMIICIDKVEPKVVITLDDAADDEHWVQVHGKSVNPQTKREVNGPWYDADDADEPFTGYWAIAYSPWDQWLNWEVECSFDATPVEQLAHILWEMSWAGYTNKDISDRAEEIFNMTAELFDKITDEN